MSLSERGRRRNPLARLTADRPAGSAAVHKLILLRWSRDGAR